MMFSTLTLFLILYDLIIVAVFNTPGNKCCYFLQRFSRLFRWVPNHCYDYGLFQHEQTNSPFHGEGAFKLSFHHEANE